MINFYDYNLDEAIEEESINIIFENEFLRIERIVSMGQSTHEGFIYDQEDDEFVIVMRGEAVIYFNDKSESVRLIEGDSLMVNSGLRHQVTYTSSPCVWLCIFYKKGKDL